MSEVSLYSNMGIVYRKGSLRAKSAHIRQSRPDDGLGLSHFCEFMGQVEESERSEFYGPFPESAGQILAWTVLYVPSLLDSGGWKT